jgi:hypothetical protein
VDSKVGTHLTNLQTNVLPGLASKDDLRKETDRMDWRVFDVDTRLLGVQQNLSDTLAGLSNDLASTNVLLGRRNSGGRSFFTATRQLFLGGDRHMVTPQTLSALRKQMCGPDQCAGAPDKQGLLEALRQMVGQPPQSDDKLIKALGEKMVSLGNGAGLTDAQKKTLKDWKSVVLNFTRVAF